MKIKNRMGNEFSIRRAVDDSIDSDADGALERTRDKLNTLTESFAYLIEMLVDKKILNVVEVSEFLNWQFTAED